MWLKSFGEHGNNLTVICPSLFSMISIPKMLASFNKIVVQVENADFSKSLVKKCGLAHELNKKKLALEFWHSATCSILGK